MYEGSPPLKGTKKRKKREKIKKTPFFWLKLILWCVDIEKMSVSNTMSELNRLERRFALLEEENRILIEERDEARKMYLRSESGRKDLEKELNSEKSKNKSCVMERNQMEDELNVKILVLSRKIRQLEDVNEMGRY